MCCENRANIILDQSIICKEDLRESQPNAFALCCVLYDFVLFILFLWLFGVFVINGDKYSDSLSDDPGALSTLPPPPSHCISRVCVCVCVPQTVPRHIPKNKKLQISE